MVYELICCVGMHWIFKYGSILTDNNILLPFASAGVCWFFDNINNTLQSVEIKLDK